MAVSGALRDKQFAAGLLSELSQKLTLVVGASGHWRPQADLGRPWGKITGDFGCCFTSPSQAGQTLLIVERESSGPGNERNILKWYEAVRAGVPITLAAGGEKIALKPDRIILCLAFMRPASWDPSDFAKTAAFCEVLAGLVNTAPATTGPPLVVIVERYASQLDCCEACGRDMAHDIFRRL